MTTPSKLVMQPPGRRLRDRAAIWGRTYYAGGNATTDRCRRGRVDAHKKMPRRGCRGSKAEHLSGRTTFGVKLYARYAFNRLSAARLRNTMRRELGTAIAAVFSSWVSVRDTVSIVRPR